MFYYTSSFSSKWHENIMGLYLSFDASSAAALIQLYDALIHRVSKCLPYMSTNALSVTQAVSN
ncbi:MAG: hypothetical protein ACYSU6_01780 [Planctomycetota bacterium]|jgi:hypothetical protein